MPVAGVSVARAQPDSAPIAPQQSQPSTAPGAAVPVRVIDQPLTVRVFQPPRTDAQFDADQKERDRRSSLNDQLLIYAALLVAVVAFLAIAFGMQAFYLGLGLRALKRSSDNAERNIMTTQRAFVYVSDLAWDAVGDSLRIRPIWTNSGTTPTRRLRIATNWKASHGELRPDFDISYARAPDNLFLGPASKAEFGTIDVPMRDVQAAIDERLHLYVWGRATYEDMFENSKPHFFEFCHRLEVAGETPASISVRFTQFGLSNGSDEDSKPRADAAA